MAKATVALPPKRKKIESFVTFTLNLIPESLKTCHFLYELHNPIFYAIKIPIFKNFALATLEILHLAPPLENFWVRI